MSVPRRKPPSINTGIWPPAASTTSGRLSMVARRSSVARPPWFETRMPSTPCSRHSLASSAVSMPLSTSFILVSFFKRSTYSHVANDGLTPPSIPCSIGVDFRATAPPGPLTWHVKQSLVSMRRKRVADSRFRPPNPSIVQTRTGQPAVSTLRTSFSTPSQRCGIELIPRRRSQRLSDVFHGGRALRRENLQRLLGPGSARRGHLALRMKHLVTPDRAKKNRVFQRLAEQLGPQIGLRDVDQSPGPELDAPE